MIEIKAVGMLLLLLFACLLTTSVVSAAAAASSSETSRIVGRTDGWVPIFLQHNLDNQSTNQPTEQASISLSFSSSEDFFVLQQSKGEAVTQCYVRRYVCSWLAD